MADADGLQRSNGEIGEAGPTWRTNANDRAPLDRYFRETLHCRCRHFEARGSLCLSTTILAVRLGAAARPAPLPFAVDARETGQWVPVAVGKKVTGNLRLEAIIAHRGAPDRFVVLSTPAKEGGANSLRDFARRLPEPFTDFRRTLGPEAKTAKMGYSGYDLHFTLHRKQPTVICELFVFADAQTLWGVLYARPSQTPASRTPVFTVLHRRVPPSPGVVAMAPYHVI